MNDNEAGGGDASTQAAHWHARLQTLPVSAKTLDQSFAWRRGEGRRGAFEAVDRLHREAGKLADRPAIATATEQAITRSAAPAQPTISWTGEVAASVVGAVAVGRTTMALSPSDGEQYATRVGKQRTISLLIGRSCSSIFKPR